jgi:hypothetical protein
LADDDGAHLVAMVSRQRGDHGVSPELPRLLDDRSSAAANHAATVAVVAILMLIVW